MRTNYKALLFDLGGVLIDINYHATEVAFEKLGVTDFKERYTQFAQNELFDRLECGQISAQHFINLLLPYTAPGTTPNEVVAAWNAMIGAFSVEKIALLNRLSQTLPLFMLSNTNELHWTPVQKAWNRSSKQEMEVYFQTIFLSHQIGKRKPTPETFSWVCEQIGFEPKDVLFIDDSPQHINGAKAAGLQTFFYEDAASFYALFS
ncbi:MAG: HAD family phosphatase [Sphingomonadales bacterium]|nr:HAD family phosphatase [Sphingomonadales bacterium]